MKSTFLLLFLAACGHDYSADTVDAAPDADPFQCVTEVTSGIGTGEHNAGLDCMGVCHDHGFTAAGTLFTEMYSFTAIVGATISITDANGHRVDMVSQRNGNFYTKAALTYPLTVHVSDCPKIQHMPMQIGATDRAGCNATACHAYNSMQGHVHL